MVGKNDDMNRQRVRNKAIQTPKRHVLTGVRALYFRIFSYYAKQDFACFYADLYIIISHLQLNVNRNQEKSHHKTQEIYRK